MPECCPQSPLYYLYPGRPMEQSFFYTRENIPPLPPITQKMKPQIPYNYPLPFEGNEPQKMSAVEPELRFDSPEEWWNVPLSNFPGESLPKQEPKQEKEHSASSEEQPPPNHELPNHELPNHELPNRELPNRESYYNLNENFGRRAPHVGILLLSLAIISLLLIR